MPDARKNKFKADWDIFEVHKPNFIGVKEISDVPLSELKRFIDWSPFFSAWRLTMAYPKIMEDPKYKEEAVKLFDDAQIYLDEIINSGAVTNKAKIGIFKASSEDEKIFLEEHNMTLNMLRSQRKMEEAKSRNRCLADYIAPKSSGKEDYMGGFIVTTGLGLETLIEKYEKQYDDYAIIMLKSLADRLAEAFAEYMHLYLRTELWGYAKDEDLSTEDLVREKYKGIRPAPGYSACPDHSEKEKLFSLLGGSDIGVKLTESCAMTPASSVSGWYFSNPEAKYFNVGAITKEQVEVYAKEKEITLEVAEKWLRPNLEY